ncbi:hypothetical protein ATZ33_11855 [Enterococcus silesiacus]|uniref:DUF5067 domain-containing protein n=1 Tax=Enterococcus silesiacus TaxID=332949 RepID=A0A0S3KCV1_9ENTE|nr:hypothetical protein [Enterococcus silesiacus]ALS02053.1 hypothetical protein ATZ33_11855 [Enterococcus silesiacus]OJG84902.1 hypothetical protein RV15_GL002880 [Enterococcus silesiacus]
MKKCTSLVTILICIFLLSACSTKNTVKENNEQSTTTKKDNAEERKLLTVENSIIDNKELQIWYEVDSDDLDNAKDASVFHLYLIKNNEIASLILDYPIDYDHTNPEHENAQEKKPLTLGEISKLEKTDTIMKEVEQRYKNNSDKGYGKNEAFNFYPLTYKTETDGTGNNVEEIILSYINKEQKEDQLTFYKPTSGQVVYDNIFVGYWNHVSSKESGNEYTRQALKLETNKHALFVWDEPDFGQLETKNSKEPTNKQKTAPLPDLKPVTIAALVAQKIWPTATIMPVIGYTNNGDDYVVNQGESPYSIQFQVKDDQILILPESKESPNTEYSLVELVNEFYSDSSSKEMTNLLTQQMAQTNYESSQ